MPLSPLPKLKPVLTPSILKPPPGLLMDAGCLTAKKYGLQTPESLTCFPFLPALPKVLPGLLWKKIFRELQLVPKEKKLGIRGSVTNSINFYNVEVPKENMIGADGRGFLIAMSTLDAGRLGIGACCVGAAKEMLEISVQYANQRRQFNQPISKFQAVQFMLAEMTIKIYAMESMLYRAASKYDEKADISNDAAIVKLFCSEGVSEVADMALQIHGGMGFSREIPVERFYRDARILRIFEGTSEIQKLIISRKTIKNNGKWKI